LRAAPGRLHRLGVPAVQRPSGIGAARPLPELLQAALGDDPHGWKYLPNWEGSQLAKVNWSPKSGRHGVWYLVSPNARGGLTVTLTVDPSRSSIGVGLWAVSKTRTFRDLLRAISSLSIRAGHSALCQSLGRASSRRGTT